MRVLHAGTRKVGSTTQQRLAALRDLGHDVLSVDTDPPQVPAKPLFFALRVSGKLYRTTGLTLFRPPDLAGAKRQILEALQASAYDILWLDKALTIERETLAEVKRLQPECRIVGSSPDDMYQRHNQTRQFLEHLALYDVFFTTKSYNVRELRSLGCPRVEFVQNSYDPHTHRPWQLSDEERPALGGPVGFIGAYERERANSLTYLATHEVAVRVWGGPSWSRHPWRHPKLHVTARNLWADDYAKAISAFDVNLCFLRKINRDLQTTRSVEIPACGGFMLAERTDEHLALFEEGKEAEFFSSDEELLDKTRYYLAHEDERKRIAAAGRERCLKSGYSNHERLRAMLSLVEKL